MNRKISFQQLFILSSLVFGLMAILIIIGCIIHYSNRGFELSDEAYYLYLSNYYKPTSYNVSAFGLLNQLACFGHATLINLRLAKLIYQLIAVLFFVWSLLRYFNFKSIVLDTKQKAFVFIIIVVTSFGHYDYLPMTLSYNSWSLILMLMCFGFILTEFTTSLKSIAILTSLSVGFLCFSMFLAKLPNGIIAMGLYGIFNLFYIKKNTILKIGGFVLGVFVGYLIILKSQENLFVILENYRVTLFEVKHAESSTYLKQIYKLIAICGQHKLKTSIALGILLIVVFIGKKLMSHIKNITTPKKKAYSYLLFSLGFILCLPFCKGNGHKSYNDFIAVGLLIVNPLLFIYLYRSTAFKWGSFFKNDIYMVITVLLLTPVFLMLGTNNAFYYSVSPTMIFAFAGILVYLVKSKINYTLYISYFNLVSCLFILSILYFGGIKKPYKQSNLNDKHYPIAFNPLLNGIYESRDAFIDATSVNYIMNYLNKEHQPFFTFFNFYGFTIINSNQTIPEMPLSTQERMLEYNDYVLSKSEIKQSKPLLLLTDTVIKNIKFNALFSKYHIKLNQNYKQVYQYQFISNKEKIYFYKSTL
jgi:hypothetical protein